MQQPIRLIRPREIDDLRKAAAYESAMPSPCQQGPDSDVVADWRHLSDRSAALREGGNSRPMWLSAMDANDARPMIGRNYAMGHAHGYIDGLRECGARTPRSVIFALGAMVGAVLGYAAGALPW